MIKFNEANGLVPVIIQDHNTMQVLMLGYMNAEAYEKTQSEKRVTFFSRSKNRLWTKGESSGNFLYVKSMYYDCDQDTLLIMVQPNGPTCHTGSRSCFGNEPSKFLYELEAIIEQKSFASASESYTAQLLRAGIAKTAQKVGEEAVELVIEAMKQDDDLFKNEAADLLYHFLVLLKSKGITLNEIETVLRERHK